MVFQDPYASLNPRKRVGQIIGTPLRLHGAARARGRRAACASCSSRVGLNPEHLNRFPHEFSGGQRQRIGIARALAMEPQLIVLDEPVSALDVSIQAQIINLLDDLQDEFGLSYLFVAHDLSVVRHVSRPDRGHVPRQAHGGLARRGALHKPIHPYTERAAGGDPDPGPAREPRARADRRVAASRPTRSTRRRAASSTRAARAPPRSAARSSRRSPIPQRPPGRLPPPAERHRRGDQGGDQGRHKPLQLRRRTTAASEGNGAGPESNQPGVHTAELAPDDRRTSLPVATAEPPLRTPPFRAPIARFRPSLRRTTAPQWAKRSV